MDFKNRFLSFGVVVLVGDIPSSGVSEWGCVGTTVSQNGSVPKMDGCSQVLQTR